MNGQSIENWWQTTGNGIGWAWTPVLKTTTPGVYSYSSNYLFEGTVNFLLRRLEFQEEFPEFPSEPTGPIEIQNSFAWSDGSPVEGARWALEEKDSETAVEGQGTEIQATWVPDERVFGQTTEDLTYEDIPFQVLARADSYTILGQKVPYQISSEFDLPAAEQFQIVNERISPENPFEEAGVPVEVKADIVMIGLDIPEQDIEWTVGIKNPEGEIVVADLAEGVGPEVVAVWDGTVNGEAVEDPQTYSFDIEAKACEDDDGGVVVGRALDGVRGQEATPVCRVAKAEVPIGKLLLVEELEFWGTETERRSAELGPFRAYDYVNNKVSSGPEWTRAGDRLFPAILKGGTTCFLRAKIVIKGLKETTGLNAASFRANATVNGIPSVLSATALEDLAVSGNSVTGIVTVPFPVPDILGRFQVALDWEVDVPVKTGGLTTLEDSTPRTSNGHMVYSVFGPVPAGSLAGGSSQLRWYHPERFLDEEPSSGPPVNGKPIRSPLDLAATWAAGVPAEDNFVNKAEAMRRLTAGFYEEGGYFYNPRTKLSQALPNSSAVSWNFYESILREDVECADASNWVKVCANFLGIPATVLLIEDPEFKLSKPDTMLWTNYVLPTGASFDSRQKKYGADIYAPAYIDDDFFGFIIGGGDERFPDGSLNPQPWVQFLWEYHQVAEYGGLIYDPASRGVSGSLAINKNPQDYFNQKNIDLKEKFTNNHTAVYGFPPAQNVLAEALANFLLASPSANSAPANHIDDYLDALLYVPGPNTGFNRKALVKANVKKLPTTMFSGLGGGGSL